MIENDSVLDIWRVRHPNESRFTWRQKSPPIQRRLDFWLGSAAIRSDHYAITLSINGLDEGERGPGFWKFNATLVDDQEYCDSE